ncbi:MAG: hypothetical protein ACOCXA_04890 [Planctomycetota bacterium]
MALVGHVSLAASEIEAVLLTGHLSGDDVVHTTVQEQVLDDLQFTDESWQDGVVVGKRPSICAPWPGRTPMTASA